MKKILLMLIIVLNTSQLYAASTDTCIDENIAREANYHLSVDPITTKMILSSAPNCDEKYALMHMANVEIANKCRGEFYYNGKVNSRGWYNQTPNEYEKHVIENTDQFDSASEGMNKITANDYWIKKIKDTNNKVLADFEYQKIKLFYNGVWEDGDGSIHNDELIKRFREWINKYPNHKKVPEAQELIERMKNYKGILIP